MNKNQKDNLWIYGKHAVRAALENCDRQILRTVSIEKNDDLEKLCARRKIKLETVDKMFFASVFGKDATHQGVAAQVKRLPDVYIEDLIADESDNRPIVLLDRVTDPQNIGSILRASAVFGARCLVIADDNSPEITATITKIASGAVESIPVIRVTNIAHTIKDLKKNGFWCVGLDERGSSDLHQLQLDGKYIFVIGGEGSGMRRLTKESCDFLVKLPSFGKFSTLNAAQAATITLYEAFTQLKRKK